jgi:hypothetical protein
VLGWSGSRSFRVLEMRVEAGLPVGLEGRCTIVGRARRPSASAPARGRPGIRRRCAACDWDESGGTEAEAGEHALCSFLHNGRLNAFCVLICEEALPILVRFRALPHIARSPSVSPVTDPGGVRAFVAGFTGCRRGTGRHAGSA